MDIRTFFGVPTICTETLYGLSESNCCKKDKTSEKVANALLPISYCLFAQTHKTPIVLCKADGTKNALFPPSLLADARFNTEQPCVHPNFVHPPPNDICVSRGLTQDYYESKCVLFKEKKTELILRQDCFFNVLQHILLRNPGKYPATLSELLSDTTLVEQPYMVMLMWREGLVRMDCVVFTDIAILRMIASAETDRSKPSIVLIDAALHEYATTGTMTYKETKTSTVAHQKVSLFPLRDLPELMETPFAFSVKSTDLVLGDIRPDISLWQEISRSKLTERITTLEAEVARLKRKYGEV